MLRMYADVLRDPSGRWSILSPRKFPIPRVVAGPGGAGVGTIVRVTAVFLTIGLAVFAVVFLLRGKSSSDD